MPSNNQGSIQSQEPAGTEAGGCEHVPRDLITGYVFDSGAMANLIGRPVVVPSAPARVVIGEESAGGGRWDTIAESGGAEVLPPGPGPTSGEVGLSVDALHKAALNVGLRKSGGGFDEVRIWCEADYGGGYAAVPGSTFDFKMGAPFPVEQPAMSLEAPLFSASHIPGPAVPPRVRWLAQLLIGVGGNVTLTRAYFYVVQLFPWMATTSLINCEGGAPPSSCVEPVSAEVTERSGAVTPLTLGPVGGPGTALPVLTPPGGGPYALDIVMDSPFDPADYTPEIEIDGAVIPFGVAPHFASVTALPAGPPGTQTTWHFEAGITAPGGPADEYQVRVTEDADPTCVFEQGFLVTIAN